MSFKAVPTKTKDKIRFVFRHADVRGGGGSDEGRKDKDSYAQPGSKRSSDTFDTWGRTSAAYL